MSIDYSTKIGFLEGIDDMIIKHEPENNVRGIIVPHAGIRYSGNIINNTYKYVNWNNFDKVLILSTNHDQGNYQPESDNVTIKERKYKLKNILSVEKNDEVIGREHSWLVQMPFIDSTKDIIICLIGTYDEKLTHELIKLVDNTTLVIANTDLLHCGDNYGFACPDNIDEYNQNTIDMIKNYDTSFSRNQLCGRSAIKTFIAIAKNKNWICNNNISYTSSDKIHKSSSSVGYVGMVFMDILKQRGGYENMEKRKLGMLEIPRAVINSDYVKKRLNHHISSNVINELLTKFAEQYELPKSIKPYGIFVTIKNRGNLRGCIGDFNVTYETGKLIAKQTLESLFMDSRFYDNMIKEEELNDLTFDINFIGERKTVYTSNDNIAPIDALIQNNFKIGEKEGHGIIIHFSDGPRATYLSSVLPELGIKEINSKSWNILVNSLRQKAGSSTSDIAKIEIYYCQEFAEGDNLILRGGYDFSIGFSIDDKYVKQYIHNKKCYMRLLK